MHHIVTSFFNKLKKNIKTYITYVHNIRYPENDLETLVFNSKF
jgi:hypothetical protein